MKKKLLILTLPLMAVLSLTNCGKDEDSENENPQEQTGPSNNNNQETPTDTTNHNPQNPTNPSNGLVDGVTVSGKEGIYTYVDLGLSSGTKWATYNVGASKPTEYGDYFAWGETKPKEVYSDSTYKWYKDTGEKDSWGDPIYEYTKYCTYIYSGTVDNKKVLDAEDDAATANWGSAWRMPTSEEIKELIGGCSWEWVNDFNGSGVNGQLGTSKKNGATIFLPAAGSHYDTDFFSAGHDGNYWSSSLYENYPYNLEFDDGYIDWGDADRTDGQSVRAVLK